MRRFWFLIALLLPVAALAQSVSPPPGSGGGGGGSTSITAANSCVVVTPSPITGTGTVGLAVTDNSKTTSYSAAAADMCNALNLTATTGTPTLTLPAVSSTVFQPGMSVTIAVTGTVNWTVTNTSGLTLSTGFPTTLYPGMNGTIVANADGTHLDWFGSPVGSTTVAGVYKVDGSTVTVSGGVLSSTGGGGGLSCDAGFTGTLGQCVWTQTANNTATFLAWTGLIRDRYTLACDGLKPVSSTSSLVIQYGDGAGPSWHTGGSAYTLNEIYNVSTSPVGSAFTSNGFAGPFQPITSGNLLSNYSANFFGLAGNGLTAVNKSMLWQSLYVSSGSGLIYVSGGGIDTTSTAAITAIRLIDGQATPANLNTGSCTLRQNG